MLFIAGPGELGLRAQANFDRFVLPALERAGITLQSVDFRVVDIAKDPSAARTDSVVATPMLVRKSPDPTVRVLGTLDESSRVLSLLDLA